MSNHRGRTGGEFPRLVIGLLAAGVLLAAASRAQDLPKLNLVDQLGLGGLGAKGVGGSTAGEEVTFAGQFQLERGSRSGRLTITAAIAPTWHIYSLTQLPGGPMKSELKVSPSPDFQLLGPFQPDQPPHVTPPEIFPVPTEEHSGEVVWTAPIRLADGVVPESLKIEVKFNGQVCTDEGACIPIMNRPIEVRFAGEYAPPLRAEVYRGQNEHVEFVGSLSPATVEPGGELTLRITAQLDPDWHIYAYAPKDPLRVSKPTLLVVTQPSGWRVEGVEVSSAPLEQATGLDIEPTSHYHENAVTWTLKVRVPADAAPDQHHLEGLIGYQTCTASSCDLPKGLKFSAPVHVDAGPAADEVPVTFTAAGYKEVAQAAEAQAGLAERGGGTAASPPRSAASNEEPPASAAASPRAAFDKSQLRIADETKEAPIWAAIAIALAGGFILNFMPCVLPVIGLKVMSFVQQAGESRARAFALNLWYTVGLMSVFMVLATMAALWSFGWGQQNQSTTFNVVMAAVVFTMGLSFLGVWEIPIPGFVGTGAANDWQAKEGITGAFSKGVITTILAVPCSGPLVATALTWASGKPPSLVYLTFFFMGLGMAAPYLVMGAFPSLMRWMPKPGAWMKTFKEVMGFVLLGTVIWILSYLPWPLVLPTVCFLFGLWAACWWVGRTPLTEPFSVKLRAWGEATAIASVIGLISFQWLGNIMSQRFTAALERQIAELQFARTDAAPPRGLPAPAEGTSHLPWQPFSLQVLEQYAAEGRTVMVDFTADWCPTCKVLEATTLNTAAVKEAIERHGVVPLVADWTEPNQEISEMLELLGSKQIPVLAIFPAGRPNEPIVLRGWYSTETLLQKLAEAGAPASIASREDHSPVAVR